MHCFKPLFTSRICVLCVHMLQIYLHINNSVSHFTIWLEYYIFQKFYTIIKQEKKKADKNIPRGPGELLPDGKLNFTSKHHNSLPNTSQPLSAFLQPNICYCCSFFQIFSCVICVCGSLSVVVNILWLEFMLNSARPWTGKKSFWGEWINRGFCYEVSV